MAAPGAAFIFHIGGGSATSGFSFGGLGSAATTQPTFSFGAPALGATQVVALPASKPTPRKDLLPELWQQVFGNLTCDLYGQEASASVALKHVVLVSKGWQVRASLFMYCLR
jgi:hypothetical protein